MKTRTSIPNFIVAMAVLVNLSTSSLFAEGIASMTTVTTKNLKTLAHHSLEVRCKSQKNRTGVSLFIKADEKHPLENFSVTIYGDDHKTILGKFDLQVTSRPITFHVADSFLDNIRIRYHLGENGLTHHVYTIEPGEVRKLSGL